jgi:hypothetical protein
MSTCHGSTHAVADVIADAIADTCSDATSMRPGTRDLREQSALR